MIRMKFSLEEMTTNPPNISAHDIKPLMGPVWRLQASERCWVHYSPSPPLHRGSVCPNSPWCLLFPAAELQIIFPPEALDRLGRARIGSGGGSKRAATTGSPSNPVERWETIAHKKTGLILQSRTPPSPPSPPPPHSSFQTRAALCNAARPKHPRDLHESLEIKILWTQFPWAAESKRISSTPAVQRRRTTSMTSYWWGASICSSSLEMMTWRTCAALHQQGLNLLHKDEAAGGRRSEFQVWSWGRKHAV